MCGRKRIERNKEGNMDCLGIFKKHANNLLDAEDILGEDMVGSMGSRKVYKRCGKMFSSLLLAMRPAWGSQYMPLQILM
jgi:hypothetical protein